MCFSWQCHFLGESVFCEPTVGQDDRSIGNGLHDLFANISDENAEVADKQTLLSQIGRHRWPTHCRIGAWAQGPEKNRQNSQMEVSTMLFETSLTPLPVFGLRREVNR